MRKVLFAIINSRLYLPYFHFSDEGAQNYISHNASQGSRNASNKLIEFLDFLFYLYIIRGGTLISYRKS